MKIMKYILLIELIAAKQIVLQPYHVWWYVHVIRGHFGDLTETLLWETRGLISKCHYSE